MNLGGRDNFALGWNRTRDPRVPESKRTPLGYIYQIMKKEQHFTFVKMDNLPALLPNAIPLVSRFFVEMSNKRQF
jgi:hypothetical protein